MKRILIILMSATAIAAGARTVADFFIAAPMYGAAPYLDANMRLDLLDYFHSNLPPKTTNMFDEKVAVLAETERSLSVSPGKDITMQYGLAVSGSDSLLVVVETLPTPMADSRVSFYTTDWKPAAKVSVAPTLDEWLSTEGMANRAKVEELLPFMTSSAEFMEDGNKLVLTNTIGSYFAESDSVGADMARWLKPQLTYVYNGKTFQLEK